jgi:hypothetical protein
MFKRIIQVFNERGIKLNCPRCGHPQNTLAPSYFTNILQPPDLKTINLQGTSIPSIATICDRCGFISQHALGTLGLLPKEEEKK